MAPVRAYNIPAAPHTPSTPQGKERYVFFSFPHIAIDSDGKVGAVSRPNRPGASAACGALIAVSVVGLTCGKVYHAAPNGYHAMPPARPPAHYRSLRLYCRLSAIVRTIHTTLTPLALLLPLSLPPRSAWAT